MSLTDAVEKQLATAGLCKTGRWLADLPETERQTFDDWFAAGRPGETMRQMCIQEGLDASRSSFNEHIRRVCSCHRRSPA
ncbi:hypothetical protein GS504_15750 [Rhodococcus hoagii]|nr:hypothetical protein [Prescottella equi]